MKWGSFFGGGQKNLSGMNFNLTVPPPSSSSFPKMENANLALGRSR